MKNNENLEVGDWGLDNGIGRLLRSLDIQNVNLHNRFPEMKKLIFLVSEIFLFLPSRSENNLPTLYFKKLILFI